MIVTCPKCGFTQPKDRYCANCGVDMSLFRKAELPLWRRVVHNWMFQAAVLALALLAVFVGLRLQQKLSTHEADDQFSDARRATVTATQAAPPPEETRAALTPSSVKLTPVPPIAVASTTPIVAATPTPTAAVAPMQVRVVYSEMPRAVFNDLVIDARGVNTEGALTTGVVMDYETHLKGARGAVTLDSHAAQALPINQPSVFFKGVRDPGSGANLGLTAQVTATANDESGLHMTVDVQRTLHEAGALPGVPSAEQTFQFEFVIPKGAAGFIGGLLPRRPLDEGERVLYRTSPVLSVMASPDYVHAQTEFVIFFQAH